MNYIGLDELLLAALKEDIGAGDITTNSCIPEGNRSEGYFIAKAEGVVCGLGIARRVFQIIDPKLMFYPVAKDGDWVQKGSVLAELSGYSKSILTAERVALNFLQHLSGVATATARAVAQVEGTKAQITDTRKSTPGMRILERYAVRIGGGCNHRFNLADSVMIKDNHIAAAGGIAKAIASARAGAPHLMKVGIETENLDQVQEALDAGADVILLDNMSCEMMTEAVQLIGGRAIVEASGNMGERNLAEVAATGVGYISIGALTHSVRALDISLNFKKQA